MRNDLEDMIYILYFIYNYIRINYVYYFSDKKQDTILNTMKQYKAYIKKRWEFNIKIFHNNEKKFLRNKFDSWIIKEDITAEHFPSYIQDQNGDAERSGGVIFKKVRNIRIKANLPEFL